MQIKLNWSVRRESGRPLSADDIERYELLVTRDGGPVDVPAPAASVTQYQFPANEPGVYGIGLVCVPKRGGRSDPATGGVTIHDETKVLLFDLTVEVVA